MSRWAISLKINTMPEHNNHNKITAPKYKTAKAHGNNKTLSLKFSFSPLTSLFVTLIDLKKAMVGTARRSAGMVITQKANITYSKNVYTQPPPNAISIKKPQ